MSMNRILLKNLQQPPPAVGNPNVTKNPRLTRSLTGMARQSPQPPPCWISVVTYPVISLVLVYAGIPTIFANFRTFIRLYLIIFIATSHSTSQRYITRYIAPLHRTPIAMSPLYVTSLPHNPMSQLYVALLCRTYVASLPPRCIASHHHCLVSLHVTSQVIGPSRAERSTTP
jgi:hypothetical protein